MKRLSVARSEVLDAISFLDDERAGLVGALGLVLAEDVVAPEDVPPFANSAMDGYAVRAADTVSTPVELQVIEDVAAGHVAALEVVAGSAIKIMTGAPMPRGADAVVKVEDTNPGDGSVTIMSGVAPGTNVRAAGGDVAAGRRVFSRGTELTPPHLGVLATLGVAFPRVYRRPRIGLLSTGDEVTPPEAERLEPGWIRDANRPLLTGLLAEVGAEVHDYGILRDDEKLLRSALLRASEECDGIITSGGVSMGEYDLVKQVLSEIGGVEFWKVAMKPAKPFAFGSISGTPLFGLPGNPVSVLVAFEQFARPAIRRMMGAEKVFRPRIQGVMGERVTTDPEKTVFLRVQLSSGQIAPVAHLSGAQASNVLSAAAAADAFAVIPAGVETVDVGEAVQLEMLRWPPSRTREEMPDE